MQTAVSDGAGGWYIGGAFTEVGGLPRLRLAHILSDGSVGPWAPTANNTVFTMLMHAGALYIGGGFGLVNGVPRPRIATLDPATGSLGSWGSTQTVSPPTVIFAMALAGGKIYLGGSISSLTISAIPYTRNNLMALDAATGAIDPWAPTASHAVTKLIASASEVYVAGDFTSLNGTARNYCGALDATTGTLLPWDPSPNLSTTKTVSSLVLHTDRIFLGGSFTQLAGLPANRLAAVDLTTGAIHPTTVPTPDASVSALALDPSGTTLFAAGSFLSMAGQDRRCMAAIDIATGSVTSLDIRHSPGTLTLTCSGTGLFNGGSFLSSGGRSRTNIAVLDGTTGVAVPTQPNVAFNAGVRAIACAQGMWYVGGDFSSPTPHLLAIDQTSGTLDTWNPAANGSVRALAVDGSSIYAAGDFTNIGGQPRNGLAELSLLSNINIATAWDPAPDGTVRALQLDASHVYAGGAFNNIGGAGHRGVASLDRSTALAEAIAYDLDITGSCNALALLNSELYIAGDFTTINGVAANRIGIVDATTGTLSANLGSSVVDGPVTAITLQSSLLFLCGNFSMVNGQLRNGVAALDPSSGGLNSFDPALTGGIAETVHGASDHLFIGGGFTGFNGFPGRSHAVYGACTGSEWFIDADGDGYGAPETLMLACEAPPGTIDTGEDCDDTDPLLYVGAECDDGDPYSEFDAIDPDCDCTGKFYGIEARLFLNGPYVSNMGLMRDDLRTASLLPLEEPYSALGYVHHAQGGGETIAPSVLSVTGNDAVVDWVFLEVRDQSEPSQVIATRSGLLQRDGDVVDLDGVSPVRLYVPSGQYHLAIRHRNHLGVMTAGTHLFTIGTLVSVHFDLPATATYGSNAQRDVSGVHTLWSGDVNGNGQVKYAGGGNDRDPILVTIGGTVPTATVNGYLSADCTLDGVVKYAGGNNDRDHILQTVGGTVPTAVRNAQLP
ncbi:MAG: PQQ-binding-like beta-propeller repeat protein [Flavobacteriales bacterium]|nr:PQQ-binding-like beta-propeller repeat protein [Flavobacteriales bacterium]